MTQKNYCIGVDFGTDSVRSLIVDAANGEHIASAVFYYPRWSKGLYCDPARQQYRQHPLDYIEGLTAVIREALHRAGPEVASAIRAISIDTTGSTPVAVNEKGEPLALLEEFSEDPDAMFVLWKDHSSFREVEEINAHVRSSPVDYLKYVGGFYSSEWFWAKLLHVLRVNDAVSRSCYSWVEHADWMPFLLTGGKHVLDMKRNICTAGHKALWSEDWGGLPPENFFASLDPLLSGYKERLYNATWSADQRAGTLCAEWAQKLGLSEQVIVGIGAMDAHMGAVGGEIAPYHLSKVMGTSTCDMLVVPPGEFTGSEIRGICGMVPGSIIPSMIGMEAGQSAFGDVYGWFKNLLSWPLKFVLKELSPEQLDRATEQILPRLSAMASQLPLQEDSELSIDWFNGRRTPEANAMVKGALLRLNLGSDAPRLFYALVEGTCFGARAIVENFQSQGIPIRGLIGIGGVAKKSPFIMQMIADVIGIPLKVHKAEQTCALGAAMFAATAAGIYDRVEDAMRHMGAGFETAYIPDPARTEIFDRRYKRYLKTGRFIEWLSPQQHARSGIPDESAMQRQD